MPMYQNRYDLDWPMSRVRFLREDGTEIRLGYIVWSGWKYKHAAPYDFYANRDASARMIAGMSSAPPLDIAKPDDPADITIMLRISGNRLVRVCNALQQMMHETFRATTRDDTLEFSSESWRDLYHIVERMRDELSAQRAAR